VVVLSTSTKLVHDWLSHPSLSKLKLFGSKS